MFEAVKVPVLSVQDRQIGAYFWIQGDLGPVGI